MRDGDKTYRRTTNLLAPLTLLPTEEEGDDGGDKDGVDGLEGR